MELMSRNPSILEKIFILSNTTALLKFRLVCRLWAEEAGRILRRKRGIAIAFRSIEDVEEFLIITRPTPITFLNFMIDIPSIYPMREDSYDEIQPEIADLLESYREHIKDLKFWYQPLIDQVEEGLTETSTTSGNSVACLEPGDDVTVDFPGLTSLQLLSNYVHSIGSVQRDSSAKHRIPKYFSKLSAPNIHSLTIQHLFDTECSSIVVNIIKNGNNSLQYLKIPAKPFSSVTLDKSISLQNLKQLDLLGIFHGYSCCTNETLDNIIKACPKLEKLGIEFSFRANLPKIQELLSTLSTTLVELRCTIQDRNLLARQIVRVDFIFPEMTKLQCLQMRWSNPGFIYYIDKLPVLKELLLDTVWTRKIQGNIYPNGQELLQEGMADYKHLTNLKLTEIMNTTQISAFSKYFPNLMVLGCSFDSDESLSLVYRHMSKLRCLIIERKSNITEAGAVCGLGEEEFCRMAGNIDEINIDSQQIVRFRPYIGDLKELEALEMCQLGATQYSVLFGIVDLCKLNKLVIQSTVFKRKSVEKGIDETENSSLLSFIKTRMNQLRTLTLWIRHSSERPSVEEIANMEHEMDYLKELKIVNHSLCGI